MDFSKVAIVSLPSFINVIALFASIAWRVVLGFNMRSEVGGDRENSFTSYTLVLVS